MVRLKRVYEAPAPADGRRVLVERLWPRGLTKARARIDLWLKDVAPSPELRKWFGHDPARWDEFLRRYRRELQAHREAVEELRRKARKGAVTLVYAARDDEHNSAAALKAFIERTLHPAPRRRTGPARGSERAHPVQNSKRGMTAVPPPVAGVASRFRKRSASGTKNQTAETRTARNAGTASNPTAPRAPRTPPPDREAGITRVSRTGAVAGSETRQHAPHRLRIRHCEFSGPGLLALRAGAGFGAGVSAPGAVRLRAGI